MSEKTTARKLIDYFQNLDEALKDGTVVSVIKINNKFYPENLSTTIAPCLCEFTKDKIILNSCNTSSIAWKKTIKYVKDFSYDDISNVKFSVLKKLNAILGVLPTYFLSLQLDIAFKNKEIITLECNEFQEIPSLIEILTSNKVPVIDEYDLGKLYKEKSPSEASKYLHENLILENK